MNKIVLGSGAALSGLAVMVILCAIVSLFFKIRWNDVMPMLFGFKEVSLFQAFELLLISSFLFKSTKQ